MKQLWAGVVLAITVMQVKAQQPFSIHGKISGTKNAKIILNYRVDRERFIDSASTKNGVFSFKGTISEPVLASITVKPLISDSAKTPSIPYKDECEFYLEPGTITISGITAENSVVKGGKTQDEFNTLQQQLSPLKKQMEPLRTAIRKAMSEKDEAVVKRISEQMHPIRKQMTAVEENFIKAHPASLVSWNLVIYRSAIIDPATFEPLFNAMDQQFRNRKEGKAIADRLEIAKKTSIGLPVMDFTQNDVNEKPVTLSSFRGKYVLLDFWASWCGPCRAENPNVLKAYNKYKENNFMVLAVSLDSKKSDWLQAIEKDGMPWTQLSDLKGFNNEVARQFGITAIPQNLLIDPNGIIIAKNLRGENLLQELERIIH